VDSGYIPDLAGYSPHCGYQSILFMEIDSFTERFHKFLTNDWIHLERKVAALEAKVHLLLAGSGIIIGLMVYAVTK